MAVFVRCFAVALLLATVVACGDKEPSADVNDVNARPKPTQDQLDEARRLLNPDNESPAPTDQQVDCVARTVVENPALDEIANDMALLPNKDLRQAVMTAYLHCAYDFIVDYYMHFAPAGLSDQELTCIRGKFTELDVNIFSEVIVEDPDAGQTGPLVIQACQSGSTVNPLENGIPTTGTTANG